MRTSDHDSAETGPYILFAEDGGEFVLDLSHGINPWPL